ncbi:MAG: tail fiber domain-containing protein, partial [Chloroflexota bacterium]|nr:tail fiber domain-containing protein [Chloroflexota bacterium]
QIGTTQTKTGVTVSNGLFTTTLDFGASAFTGDARWLAIGVKCGTDSSYTALNPRQELTPAPYALYSANAGNMLWSGLTGVPAGFADGVDNDTTTFWSLTGNSATTGGTNFLGTTDAVTLTLRANNVVGWRLAPNGTSRPNVIGGYIGNTVTSGVEGATIGGGGLGVYPNRVTDDFGTIGGGYGNRAGDDAGTTGDKDSATVGGGWSNTASGRYATVGGGNANTASGPYATVGGGNANTASGSYATVGGGNANTASNLAATVGGGWSNTASNSYTTVGGGYDNTASGYAATIVGGVYNSAAGDYSVAAGRRAKANNHGCFVWGDGTNADITCNTDNRTIFRSTGGFYIYTNSGLTSGAYLSAGGSAWNAVSDRNAKANFAPVDGREILDRLARIPIETWNYKSQESSIRHIGPMAQDFAAAFKVGEDDKTISTIDADGVALAAIQGLYQIVQEKDAQIAAQQKQIDSLEARLTALEQQAGNANAAPNSQTVMLGAGVLVLLGVVYHERRANRGAR